jgi:hypothetical protein
MLHSLGGPSTGTPVNRISVKLVLPTARLKTAEPSSQAGDSRAEPNKRLID